MSSNRLNVLFEVALFAAMALVLDLVVPSFGAVKISIKMLPIIIVALRRGVGPGVFSGLIWGLLQVLVGDADILSITQFLLEYFVAFALVGLAGVVSKRLQKLIKEEPKSYGKQALIANTGLIIGSFARYLIHFIAGFVFWGAYAEGQGAVLYSLSINGTAFLTETISCLVVLVLLSRYYKQIILVD